MGEYSKQGFILLDGVQLMEPSEVRLRINSNDKPVKTLARGQSGHSNGAEDCSIEFTSAIPITGYEAEFNAITMRHQTVKLGFRIGTKQYECEGRFMDTDTQTSVDNPNSIALSFHGKVISETNVG